MSSTLPPFSDLNATWTFIQPGLEYILGAHGEQGVTATVYMELLYCSLQLLCQQIKTWNNPGFYFQ